MGRCHDRSPITDREWFREGGSGSGNHHGIVGPEGIRATEQSPSIRRTKIPETMQGRLEGASTPVALRSARRGGVDSHALPAMTVRPATDHAMVEFPFRASRAR
jgi:hypothetical protein